MSQAFWTKLASPEVFFLLLVFATLLTILVLQAFFYEPRAILCAVLFGGVLGMLYRYGYVTVAIAAGIVAGLGVVLLTLYYVIKQRKSRVLRWMGAAMLASVLLAALLVLL